MVLSGTMADTSATAEGELGRTPLAHLLVYALDRRLSGALFLCEREGMTHVVRLVRGVPVKVRPGDRYALLGEMLVEAGAIDEATLAGALGTNVLLGDVLLLADRVQRDTLERVAEQQFVRRMVRLFDLPPTTTYRYHEGHDELADYGGDPACCDPVALLWAGLRAHAESSAQMEATLAIVGDAPLRLHHAATVARYGVEGPEATLVQHLQAQPATMTELSALAPAEVVRRLVYALVITRQLELGTASSGPLGAPDSSRSPQVVAPVSTLAAVAKMQLRSQVHREGAAAPDLPGDGERGPVVPVARSSSRRFQKLDPTEPDGPPTTRSSQPEPAPVSSVKATPTEEAPSSARDSGVQPIAPVEPVKLTAGTTLKSQPTPRLTPTDAAPPKTAADPLAGLTVAELLDRARERLAAKDPRAALAPCDAARRAAPTDPDVVALAVWVRSLSGGADLKALRLDLDDLLRLHADHVPALFYRAMLHKRLNEGGAPHDLRRALELEPDHTEAARELAALEARPAGKERPSLFGRLFKR
jgi:hypothetical protein